MRKFAFLASLSFLCLFAAYAADRGPVMFNDDFDTVALFAENWAPKGDVTCSQGKLFIPKFGNVLLKKEAAMEFGLTVEMAISKYDGDKDPDGFCGVDIDGIKFLIRSDGKAWNVYSVAGEEKARGSRMLIEGFRFGQPYTLSIDRNRNGDSFMYVFRVGEQQVTSFSVEATEKKPRISLLCYKLAAHFDNFQIKAAFMQNGSPNLVVNSSFEYHKEGMPPYFDFGSLRRFNYTGAVEEYYKTCSIDEAEKNSGKSSLRLECNSLTPEQGIYCYEVGVAVGKPVACSIYLKASENKFPAQIVLWEMRTKHHKKNIILSKQWERYTFSLTNAIRSSLRMGVSFTQKGIVWADDIQIEQGITPTEYRPSAFDKEKFSSQKQIVQTHPDITVKKVEMPASVDGDLSKPWINEAAKIDSFWYRGNVLPPEKTVAWIACDDDALYIAIRCYVDDMGKLRAGEYLQDDMRTFADDHVEVFLDCGQTRETYYQLGVNAANSQADVGKGRNVMWSGIWQSAVRKNEKEKAVDYELRIPFSTVSEAKLSEKWGINLGRLSTASDKATCITRNTDVNFHKVVHYPTLLLPNDVVKHFAVEVDAVEITGNGASGVQLAFSVLNMTGADIVSEVSVLSTNGSMLGQRKMMLVQGKNFVPVRLENNPPENVTFDVKIMDGDKIIFKKAVQATCVKQIDLSTRYNYYMNEDQAEVFAAIRLPDVDTMKVVLHTGSIRVEAAAKEDLAIKFPISTLPYGEHVLAIDVINDQKIVSSGRSMLIKRPGTIGATQIDRQRRCLIVDGKPFLPIAQLCEIRAGGDVEMFKRIIDHLALNGFRSIMLGCTVAATNEIIAILNYAEKKSIKVILTPWDMWKNRENINIAAWVRQLALPSTIAYLAVDEPELYAKSEEIKTYLSGFRAHTPYHPTFMNNTVIGIPGRFADLNTDILMLDDYLSNRENRKLEELVRQAFIMRTTGLAEGKPSFFFLSGKISDVHHREITYDEQIAQTYGVIAAGCTGVSYFLGQPDYPRNWEAIKQCNKELFTLEPVIFSTEKCSAALVSDAGILSLTRRAKDRIWVITVNISERDIDATIKLPAESRYGSGNVAFEDRTILESGGKIADNFKPLSRHVYSIEVK